MIDFITASDSLGDFLLYSKRIGNKPVDFSFIVGAYNAAATLQESMQSLIDQDYDSFEIIVVDDGSSDNTFELIYSLYRQVDNIIIIKQGNIGLTSSLNRCIEIANGKYIVRHDIDDISYEHRLSALKTYFEHGELFLMSYADVEFSKDNLKLTPRDIYFKNGYLQPEALLFGNAFVHGTFAFTKEFIQEIKYDNEFRLAQDYELLIRVSALGYKIKIVPHTLYRFIKSASSVSYTRYKEQTRLAELALVKNNKTTALLIIKHNKYFGFIIKLFRDAYMLCNRLLISKLFGK